MRKIIQIAFQPCTGEDDEIDSTMWAVCDDGTVWYRDDWRGQIWVEMTPELKIEQCTSSE